MNKQELINAVVEYLEDDGKRKPVRVPESTLTISDDSGTSKKFKVAGADKTVKYTKDDVSIMYDYFVEVIIDSIKNGESVRIPKIGTIGFVLRPSKKYYDGFHGEYRWSKARYEVRLRPASALKDAASIYSLTIEQEEHDPEPIIEEDLIGG